MEVFAFSRAFCARYSDNSLRLSDAYKIFTFVDSSAVFFALAQNQKNLSTPQEYREKLSQIMTRKVMDFSEGWAMIEAKQTSDKV